MTATDPTRGSGLVFGYCWKRADYPWISLWCCSRDDGYMSRGIEFGTTGLHKPFPMLAKHPTLFGLPTFHVLDAQESQTRGYAMFLAEVPEQYAGQVTGVSKVVMDGDQLTLTLTRGAEDQESVTVNLPTAGVAL